MQHECSTEKVLDKEPYRPVIESADVSMSPVKETEYDLKGHAVHCEMEFNVSKRFLTQEDSSACSDPKEDIHVMTTVIQGEKGTNGHSEEEIMHTTGPGVQGQITIRGSVTFATPLEEYFEYAVSLDTIDEISELPALECGSTDYEISMYDVEENKLTDWKIPSSLDVTLAKRKHNEGTETCHYPDIIQECIRDDEPLEQKCQEQSDHSFPTHTKSIVPGGDVSQQSESQVEDKESDDQKSLREDAFSLIYREPSELLDTSLDNDMTEAAIKRCIDNDEGLAYGCSQEEQILPNMNCYGVSSSPTACMEQSGNGKDSLHPEVKQVIACVVQQVMAAIPPAEDVVMQQECQECTDLVHKAGKETQLDSVCNERCSTVEASEKTKEPLKISIDCVKHGVKESERVKMKEEAESLSQEGVVTPVRQSDIEGASVLDRAVGSPLIPSQFSTSNNFPNSVSESSHVAERNVDGKIEIQCEDDVSLKLSKPEDNQVSGFLKQADRQVELEAIAFESNCHVPSVEIHMKNDDENAAQEVKKLDLLLSQEDMFDAETVDDNSGILIQDDMQKYSLKDIVQMKDSDAKVVVSPEKRRKIENSSAEDEGISQAHIPELQDNGPASDTLEHEPHNQSISEGNGDNLIEIDNDQCKNVIIKVPEESKPLDVEVLPKVVRQEYPNEMGAYVSKALSTIAQTDTVNKDMDSSQTLFQSIPSPGPSQPSSLPHRNPLNDGLQVPVTDANVDTCTRITEALHDSESGLKTETQSATETPYSVTDSPYIASSDRGSTTHGQDVVRSCSQDDALYGNTKTATKTPFMEQSLNSSTSGQSTPTSQDHTPIQEAQASVAPNTSEHHDVFKEQKGMTLLTPTSKGGSETGREISEPMKLEPTDIELLVEEISQKLDLTMEHLSPAPSQKQRDEDSSTPLSDPLKSDFVKVSVVRSESQSSIICLQSLHDHIPDAETDETNTRDELGPQRHSLKRRSVSQDLVIPTKTQRSENTDQGSQPHHMAPQEDSADSSVDGEASSGEIQPTTFNDVGISSRSPVKEWAVPESHLMGRKGQLEASPRWREDQAVPDNREGPKATLQCHLVEHDSLSIYDDGTTDLKKVAAYRLSPNHDKDTALKPETFQQCPPDSATDNISSPSTSSEGSVKSHSPRHNDHQRVPDSPRSSFRWKYAPSVDFDSASVLHENMIDEDTPSEMCRLQPLVTCRRPLRVGLSRRHRGPSLHPNFRPSHRLDDM